MGAARKPANGSDAANAGSRCLPRSSCAPALACPAPQSGWIWVWQTAGRTVAAATNPPTGPDLTRVGLRVRRAAARNTHPAHRLPETHRLLYRERTAWPCRRARDAHQVRPTQRNSTAITIPAHPRHAQQQHSARSRLAAGARRAQVEDFYLRALTSTAPSSPPSSPPAGSPDAPGPAAAAAAMPLSPSLPGIGNAGERREAAKGATPSPLAAAAAARLAAGETPPPATAPPGPPPICADWATPQPGALAPGRVAAR